MKSKQLKFKHALSLEVIEECWRNYQNLDREVKGNFYEKEFPAFKICFRRKTAPFFDDTLLKNSSHNFGYAPNFPPRLICRRRTIFHSKPKLLTRSKVSVGGTPTWGMKTDAGHARGLWQTFIARQAFGDEKGKTVGITFGVPAGNIVFSDIVICYQRNISQ